MQCIIKERKDSFATEFNGWINSIQSSFPDGVYILNLTDAVILRHDNKPYWEPHIIKRGGEQPKFLPVLGYSGAYRFFDIPIPNFDDIDAVMSNKPLPKSKYNWDDKIPKAIFRGNPTGCGTDSETNMRIKLAEMMADNSEYLDVGLIKTTNNMPRFDPEKGLRLINVNAEPVNKIEMEDQGKYKYIVHVDGNVAAYRLLKMMLLGSVILKVEGKYNLWIEQLLQDGVNFISVNSDMSDLIEKIEWCRSHDDECKIIAENAAKLAKKVLTKDYIDNSFIHILFNLKRNIDANTGKYVPDESPEFIDEEYYPRTPDGSPPGSPEYYPRSPPGPPPEYQPTTPEGTPPPGTPQYQPTTPEGPPPFSPAPAPAIYAPAILVPISQAQIQQQIIPVPTAPSRSEEIPEDNKTAGILSAIEQAKENASRSILTSFEEDTTTTSDKPSENSGEKRIIL